MATGAGFSLSGEVTMESDSVLYIPVLLGTSRIGRQSIRVARAVVLVAWRSCGWLAWAWGDFRYQLPFPPRGSRRRSTSKESRPTLGWPPASRRSWTRWFGTPGPLRGSG